VRLCAMSRLRASGKPNLGVGAVGEGNLGSGTIGEGRHGGMGDAGEGRLGPWRRRTEGTRKKTSGVERKRCEGNR